MTSYGKKPLLRNLQILCLGMLLSAMPSLAMATDSRCELKAWSADGKLGALFCRQGCNMQGHAPYERIRIQGSQGVVKVYSVQEMFPESDPPSDDNKMRSFEILERKRNEKLAIEDLRRHGFEFEEGKTIGLSTAVFSEEEKQCPNKNGNLWLNSRLLIPYPSKGRAKGASGTQIEFRVSDCVVDNILAKQFLVLPKDTAGKTRRIELGDVKIDLGSFAGVEEEEAMRVEYAFSPGARTLFLRRRFSGNMASRYTRESFVDLTKANRLQNLSQKDDTSPESPTKAGADGARLQCSLIGYREKPSHDVLDSAAAVRCEKGLTNPNADSRLYIAELRRGTYPRMFRDTFHGGPSFFPILWLTRDLDGRLLPSMSIQSRKGNWLKVKKHLLRSGYQLINPGTKNDFAFKALPSTWPLRVPLKLENWDEAELTIQLAKAQDESEYPLIRMRLTGKKTGETNTSQIDLTKDGYRLRLDDINGKQQKWRFWQSPSGRFLVLLAGEAAPDRSETWYMWNLAL